MDDEEAREMLRLALLADDAATRDYEDMQARRHAPVAAKKPPATTAPKTDGEALMHSFSERFHQCMTQSFDGWWESRLDASLDEGGQLGEIIIEALAEIRDRSEMVRKNDLDNLQYEIERLSNTIASHDAALVELSNNFNQLENRVEMLESDQIINNSASNISLLRR